MAINFSHRNDISLYSSDRQVHLAANGCLTFTPDTPNMRDLFSAEEMVYFSDFEDLKKKIMHYQAHPDEGRLIAEAGHARAHRDYECQVGDRPNDGQNLFLKILKLNQIRPDIPIIKIGDTLANALIALAFQ